MTREEWAATLLARAAEAERWGAVAPLAVTLRALVAELGAVDGVPARPAPDRLLTLEEAAGRLGMTPRAVREGHERFPFLKQLVPGGPWRASEKALERWLATR